MYDKICNIIKKNFGTDVLSDLAKDITDKNEPYWLPYVISHEQARDIIEILLKDGGEDVYWFIWDNMSFVGFLNRIDNPGELTKQLRERYKKARNDYYNLPYHVSDPVTTERLRLAPMDDAVAEYLKDEIKKEGESEDFVNSLNLHLEAPRIFFSITDINDNKPIGYIGLTLLERFGAAFSESTCNLEYYITPEARRKGYLKEAAQKVIEMAFDRKTTVQNEGRHSYVMEKTNLLVKMIKIMCDVNNLASYKCAVSLGFKEEGTLSFVKNGEIYQEYVMSKDII